MKPIFRTASLALVVGLGGCGILPTTCTDELGFAVEPDQRTLRVGETLQARAYEVTCGGRRRSRLQAAWRTDETGVVSVNEETGLITAVAPGAAEVAAFEQGMGATLAVGSVRVQVVAP
jgi:hypothetical protein